MMSVTTRTGAKEMNRRFLKSIACAILVVAVTGCGRVRSNVTTFSELTADDIGSRVIIMPYEEQENSLEWRSYARMLADHFRNKGYEITDDINEANLAAFFGYGIDEGQQVTSTYSIPQFGVTGYSGAYTTGTVSSYGSGYGTYTANTTLIPQYGVTGYSTGTKRDTVYTRSLWIDLLDVESYEKKWEMRLTSQGSCASFKPVAPTFFEAAFQSFPMGDGGEVTLPFDMDKC